MITSVRKGRSMRSVAKKHGVSLATVQKWVQRAAGLPLSKVDLGDRVRGPKEPSNRTPGVTRKLIIRTRAALRKGVLGEYGAVAVHDELVRLNHAAPTVRTIGRIIAAEGLVGLDRRVRRPPPPRGWYLPDVAAGAAEVDCFDSIEGLVFKGGYAIEVLNCISLHGRLAASWQTHPSVTSRYVMASIREHWREFDVPAYAQFDNDMVFAGCRQRDCIGSVIRACISLGVVPVFAPPREQGFQPAIERFNGLWQEKVWHRCLHPDLLTLMARSGAFIAAHRQRHRQGSDAALRRPFPAGYDPQAPLKRTGSMIFIRRTDHQGRATVLGRTFSVSGDWVHRLVRAEVSLDAQQITFHRLRRRDPDHQPIIASAKYILPQHQLDP
jgi:hypothetical protein